MKPQLLHSSFVRFVLVGGGATALHYGIYYGLQFVMNVNIAYSIGYVCSFLVNFYLTARFTFREKASWGKAAGFGVAHLCNYLIHIGLLNLFLYMGLPKSLAPIPVFAIAIPVNFFMVRFVFTSQKFKNFFHSKNIK